MELGIPGLVTAEGTLRLWTRQGSFDVQVGAPDRLRDILGGQRVDREPMLPGGALTELLLVDLAEQSLVAVAPFQPTDERLFPLGPPFDFRPVPAPPRWTAATLTLLGEWLATRVESAALRGEALHLFERDAHEQGQRRAHCCYLDEGDGWCGAVGTDAPNDDVELWRTAGQCDGFASLRFPLSGETSAAMAMAAMMSVADWPGGPHDVVLGWSPAPNGRRPADATKAPQSSAAMNLDVPKTTGNVVVGLLVPHDPACDLRLVQVDRRSSVNWQAFLSGGPAEGVGLPLEGFNEHDLYVNARYADLPEATVNHRATTLLQQLGIGMFLGHIRGDALLLRGEGRGSYPRSVEQSFVDALTQIF